MEREYQVVIPTGTGTEQVHLLPMENRKLIKACCVVSGAQPENDIRIDISVCNPKNTTRPKTPIGYFEVPAGTEPGTVLTFHLPRTGKDVFTTFGSLVVPLEITCSDRLNPVGFSVTLRTKF